MNTTFRYVKYVFDKYQFAIICGESIEDLIKLTESKKLTTLISRKKVYGDWIFAITESTYYLIKSLRALGVTRIFDLIKDSQINGFSWNLKRDMNELDLSSYY